MSDQCTHSGYTSIETKRGETCSSREEKIEKGSTHESMAGMMMIVIMNMTEMMQHALSSASSIRGERANKESFNSPDPLLLLRHLLSPRDQTLP